MQAEVRGRAHRAETLWSHGAVRPLRGQDEGKYEVHSQTAGRWYFCQPPADATDPGWCDCPDFQRRLENGHRGTCKHQQAALIFLQRGKPRLKPVGGRLVPVADAFRVQTAELLREAEELLAREQARREAERQAAEEATAKELAALLW